MLESKVHLVRSVVKVGVQLSPLFIIILKALSGYLGELSYADDLMLIAVSMKRESRHRDQGISAKYEEDKNNGDWSERSSDKWPCSVCRNGYMCRKCTGVVSPHEGLSAESVDASNQSLEEVNKL